MIELKLYTNDHQMFPYKINIWYTDHKIATKD